MKLLERPKVVLTTAGTATPINMNFLVKIEETYFSPQHYFVREVLIGLLV